jgi:hypothetical protein
MHYTPYVPKVVFVRAGAEDNTKKPSVIGGVPTPYKKPFGGCVGVLKDKTPHSFN